MAKMSKGALKSLIKECIIEVLQEGLGFDGMLAEQTQPRARERSSHMDLGRRERASARQRRKHPVLDAPALRRESPPSLSNRVPNSIASVSNDPAIQALLEDTAHTTLQKQNAAENSRGPQAQSDIPLEALGLMGAKTSTWETLAFTNAPVNSNGIKPE